MKRRLALHWQILSALLLATLTAAAFRGLFGEKSDATFVTAALEGCKLVGEAMGESQAQWLDDGEASEEEPKTSNEKAIVPNWINRVLLVSDGLANHGITDPAQLAAVARQKQNEGIRTTTMGVGMDFNEDLMREMASEGGGRNGSAAWRASPNAVSPSRLARSKSPSLRAITDDLVSSFARRSAMLGGMRASRSSMSARAAA